MKTNVLRFSTRADCQKFLDSAGILAMPHPSLHDWIAIVFDSRGVFGVISETEMELLPDW